MKKISKGAEAVLCLDDEVLIKQRIKKNYRLEDIDILLRKSRTKKEAKILKFLNENNLDVPKIYSFDDFSIKMQFLNGICVKDCLKEDNFEEISIKISNIISKIHKINVIHGDLTTSNMIFFNKKVYFIDFGLSYFSTKIEDKAVDLHLLKRALDSKHSLISEKMFEIILSNYYFVNKNLVLKRFEKVENRGRNKNK